MFAFKIYKRIFTIEEQNSRRIRQKRHVYSVNIHMGINVISVSDVSDVSWSTNKLRITSKIEARQQSLIFQRLNANSPKNTSLNKDYNINSP